MKIRKLQMLAIALVALSFATAYFAYPLMPQRVASHWDMDGNANGYMPRGIGVYFMPILGAAIFCLMYILPFIDPKKENYRRFQAEYDGMVAIIIAFMCYVYLLTLAYNAGYSFNMSQFLAPAFGALFIYLGVVLAKAKQNWFVGIRTPWTLSSEKVWGRTHALGSKLFMAAGMVALLGVVLPQMFVASIAVVLAAAVATFAYSYIEYRKEMNSTEGAPLQAAGYHRHSVEILPTSLRCKQRSIAQLAMKGKRK
ncbi:MAG: SdpI family protein [Candidatus Micrarchaeota archaeon]|nr:SdpI family protein [Candidatus Micrarchaeota archaeon]